METAVSTPSATPSDSATPVTATPSTAPLATPSAPSERPRTMAEAFARDAAQPTTDAPTSTDAPTTQAAEATDPAGDVHPSIEKPAGPIPFDAHKKALENARVKATAEAQAAFDQQFGWAKQITPERIQEWQGLAAEMSTNPVQFVQRFVAELRNHPVYGPQLKSEAARQLAQRSQAARPDPDVAITDASGRVIDQTYSAKGYEKLLAYERSQWLAQVQAEIAPLKQDRERAQAEHQAQQVRADVETKADSLLARAQTWEGYAAHEPEIAQVLQANPEWSLQDAYLDVFARVIQPGLSKQAESKVLDTLKTKAAAQSVNPAGAAVASSHRPRSLLDANLKWS